MLSDIIIISSPIRSDSITTLDIPQGMTDLYEKLIFKQSKVDVLPLIIDICSL